MSFPNEDHPRRLASNVRRLRADQALSLRELSHATGLSKANLSRLEGGRANPSLETLWRLAHAFGVSIGELIEDDRASDARVLRSSEGVAVASAFGMRGRLLETDGGPHRTEVFELVLPAGAEFHGEPHSAGTRELVYCVTGSMTTGPEESPLSLGRGDTAFFSGSQAHLYKAGNAGARAVLVMSYPARPGPRSVDV